MGCTHRVRTVVLIRTSTRLKRRAATTDPTTHQLVRSREASSMAMSAIAKRWRLEESVLATTRKACQRLQVTIRRLLLVPFSRREVSCSSVIQFRCSENEPFRVLELFLAAQV